MVCESESVGRTRRGSSFAFFCSIFFCGFFWRQNLGKSQGGVEQTKDKSQQKKSPYLIIYWSPENCFQQWNQK
jgi:hypothetical protein